ncbi:hypothetical protein HMPREF1866_00475 [Lachnoanaerobaculum saburreum]|uniref:Uncharacterized protein n=1 Tax=Lachnoanaerobaculum saburreum TaxID=467210 RepID=A0A133ZYJ0_9FIRM|nr:hypothetical protein HMPREF1866_00475 [Lachnoanaerobaculum saburreum]
MNHKRHSLHIFLMIGQGTIGKSVPRQKRDKLEVVDKYKYRVLFLGKMWR